MDDLSPSSGIKETKNAPARPPLPSSANASSQPSSSGEEKSPPKRLAKPVPMPSSIQQHLDELRDLQKHKVRWFYKEGKKWIPFNGKDSLVMEEEWQALQKETDVGMSEKPSKPTVRGKLFEVDLLQRQCSPLYWKGIKLLLFCYFISSSLNYNHYKIYTLLCNSILFIEREN